MASRERGRALVTLMPPRSQPVSPLAIWRRRMQDIQARLKQKLRLRFGSHASLGTAGLLSELSAMENRQRELLAHVARTEAELADLRTALNLTRESEQQAVHQALHDPLTGLPNRRYFLSHLEQVLHPPQRGTAMPCVVYLDLDHFKQVNDTYGHPVGDEMLKMVASRLAHTLRTDDMVARLGGDEFACVLPDAMTNEQLLGLAQKLFHAVAAPMQLGRFMLRVEPSIGLSRSPDNGHSAGVLLARADAAMYHAKRHATRVAFAPPGEQG